MAGKRRRKGRKRSPEDLVDHGLMKVLAKRQRVRIYAILAERVASPKEISEETGKDIGSVSYHVKVLRDHGLIERGAGQSQQAPDRRRQGPQDTRGADLGDRLPRQLPIEPQPQEGRKASGAKRR